MEIKKIVLSENEIETICSNIAEKIDEQIKNDERMPLFIAVMDGAIPFFSKLYSKIKTPSLEEFIKVKSYEGNNQSGKISFIKDIHTEVDGRTVIIVEDVVDTGYTMKFLSEYLTKKGKAKRVLVASLFDKTYARKTDVKIDFAGKVLEENDFLMGFGLDFEGLYRNIPYVYVPTDKEIERMIDLIVKDKSYYKHHKMPTNVSIIPGVHILDHPLLKHKISLLRKVETKTAQFRELVKEIGMLIGYEVFKGLPVEYREIQTPIEKSLQPHVSGKSICYVPILRAGLGMVDGFTSLFPSTKVGHIGMYRDEVTHEPHEYYVKLPSGLEDMECYILDPMLATGGSAIDAVNTLKKHGAKNIRMICIIAAPEGVEKFAETCPDVPLYVGALDRCLNEHAYICPGLGDCGDRIFGTENPNKE